MNSPASRRNLYVRPQRDIQELAARRALVGAYEVREGIEKALKLPQARIDEIRHASPSRLSVSAGIFQIHIQKHRGGRMKIEDNTPPGDSSRPSKIWFAWL